MSVSKIKWRFVAIQLTRNTFHAGHLYPYYFPASFRHVWTSTANNWRLFVIILTKSVYTGLQACLEVYRKHLKVCASCGRDVQNDKNAFFAPVEGKGFKDFCSHACLSKYDGGGARKPEGLMVPTPPTKGTGRRGRPPGSGATGQTPMTLVRAKCSVCAKHVVIKHEVRKTTG